MFGIYRQFCILSMKKLSGLTSCRYILSALQRYFYENLLGKQPGPKVTVHLSQVLLQNMSAGPHLHVAQVSLYLKKFKIQVKWRSKGVKRNAGQPIAISLIGTYIATVKPPISGQPEQRTPANNGQKLEVQNELL